MSKTRKTKCVKGVITVFFSLTLLVMLSLITTLLESARITASTAMAKTMTGLSAESVLSGYYLPLYEEYQVFGYWCDETDTKQQLKDEFLKYFRQNSGEGGWLDFHVSDAKTISTEMLTEKNGMPFQEQVLEYAKYLTAGYAIEEILEALGAMEKTEAAMSVLQRKYEAETVAAQAEGAVLTLAGCVDGFVVTDGFFDKNWLGRIKVRDCFVKKLIPENCGQSNVGVADKQLYERMKGQYKDPIQMLDYIQAMKELSEQLDAELLVWREKQEELTAEYEQKKEVDTEDAQLEQLEKRLQKIAEEIQEKQKNRDSSFLNMEVTYRDLQRMMQETLGAISEAETLLEQIKKEKENAILELESYLQELYGKQGELEPELYEQMCTEAESLLTDYRTSAGFGILPDIEAAQRTLANNRICIGAAALYLSGLDLQKAMDNTWKQHMQVAKGQYQAMGVTGLQFEYGCIFEAEEENGFRKLASELAEYGILAMVLEHPEAVSNAVIADDLRPSAGYTEQGGSVFEVELKSLFSGNFDSGILKQLGMVGKAGLDAMADELLYLIYLEKHFAQWTNFFGEKASESVGQMEGLKYQKEYILSGKEKDSSNLTAMIMRIFLVRFAMNLTTILSHKELSVQAKGAATAIVGFTGITALVLALQFLIEVIWSAECALTETTALLLGKKCRFVVGKDMLAVGFTELLSFGKSSMQAKAKALSGGGALNKYEDYLRVFLLLQNAELRNLRTMDLVQQTVQLKYDEEFLLKKCMSSFRVKATAEIPYRFLIYAPGLGQGGNRRVIYYDAEYCVE